jgi:hypothetical protein
MLTNVPDENCGSCSYSDFCNLSLIDLINSLHLQFGESFKDSNRDQVIAPEALLFIIASALRVQQI